MPRFANPVLGQGFSDLARALVGNPTDKARVEALLAGAASDLANAYDQRALTLGREAQAVGFENADPNGDPVAFNNSGYAAAIRAGNENPGALMAAFYGSPTATATPAGTGLNIGPQRRGIQQVAAGVQAAGDTETGLADTLANDIIRANIAVGPDYARLARDRAAATAATAAQATAPVLMVTPDNTLVQVPANRIAALQAQGYQPYDKDFHQPRTVGPASRTTIGGSVAVPVYSDAAVDQQFGQRADTAAAVAAETARHNRAAEGQAMADLLAGNLARAQELYTANQDRKGRQTVAEINAAAQRTANSVPKLSGGAIELLRNALDARAARILGDSRAGVSDEDMAKAAARVQAIMLASPDTPEMVAVQQVVNQLQDQSTTEQGIFGSYRVPAVGFGAGGAGAGAGTTSGGVRYRIIQ